jgi:hypothetical protein
MFAFLDDWTLVSQTFEQGLDLLKRVFERIRISGLKLKPSKCKLFQTKAKILGVIVSDGQVSEDPARANKIRDWRFPRTAKEMRGFIAFANFGRQHYPNFSEKIKPLTDCLKKGAKVECNTETLRAFEEVKAIMTNPPVLTLFDSSARSVVEVDSSAFAMGAVLKNRYEDGSEKVVAYASKCLNPAQTRYCTTRRELLGIIFALKTWRHFLIGRPVIIRTDHAALQYLLKGKTLTNQLARYLDFVADYVIEIEWISGGKNAIADFLSRMTCSDSCKQCHASPARVRHMRSARDGTWLDRQPDMRPTCLSGAVTDVGVAMIPTNGDIRSDRPARAEERPLVSLSESCSRALSGATFACSQDAATCDCAAGCSGNAANDVVSAGLAVQNEVGQSSSSGYQQSTAGEENFPRNGARSEERAETLRSTLQAETIVGATPSDMQQPGADVRQVQTRAARRRVTETDGYGDRQVAGEAQTPASDMTNFAIIGASAVQPAAAERRNNRGASCGAWPNVLAARSWNAAYVRDHQQGDPAIAEISRWLVQGNRPQILEIRNDADLCAYHRQFQSLSIVDGIVYRAFVNKHGCTKYYQLLVPSAMRSAFLELVHISVLCHCKTFEKKCQAVADAWVLAYLEEGSASLLSILQAMS